MTTTTELIQTIRSEVENWLKEYAEDSQFELGERYGYKRVLSLLDTLESGKLINLDELKEEIESYWKENGPMSHAEYDRLAKCARHFAQWGAEHLKK